jgi:glutathione peroxidase
MSRTILMCRSLLLLLSLALLAAAPGARAQSAPASCPSLLRHSFNQLQNGEAQSLCRYQGKVLLIVNVASKCGYTPQYEGLEAMYRKYKDRGLVVVGFPSNDFGGQEPGSNKQIAEFCRTTYGVQFPLYEKASVTDLAQNALYSDLAKATGSAPKWNFHKYVVDRDGKPVASFVSDVEPNSKELTALIEKLLDKKAASGG